MEVFGIGPMELILILIIALMVFGPDKLPEIGAKLGKGLRSMREATREFSKEIEETRAALEAPIKEVTEPIKEVRQAAQAMANPGEAVRKAVIGEIAAADAAARVPAESTAAEAGSAGVSATETVAQTGTVVGTGEVVPPTWAPPAADESPASAAVEEGVLAPLPYVPSDEDTLSRTDGTGHQGYTADQFFPRPAEPLNGHNGDSHDAAETGATSELSVAAADIPESNVGETDYFPELDEAPTSRADLTRLRPVAAQPVETQAVTVLPAAAAAEEQPTAIQAAPTPDGEATGAEAAQAETTQPEAAAAEIAKVETREPEATAAETDQPEAAPTPSGSEETDSLDLPALPAPEE